MAEVKQTTGDQVYIKQHLLHQIDNLKSDIQDLINKKKTAMVRDKVNEYNLDKQKKMEQLKILNEKLKEIHKRERLEIQKRNELKSISRAMDTIDFGAAKKRKDSAAMDRAKLAKVQREDVRNKYFEYQETERKYMEYDIKTLPGFLFLHKEILKAYGLCPYVEIDFNNTDKLQENRITWLQSKDDTGALYFEKYRQLVEKQDITDLNCKRTTLEGRIYKFVEDILTPSQYNLYTASDQSIIEYSGAHIKTKRLKEKFKITINDLSILFSETGIEFHNYLSVRYDIPIIVNTINVNQTENGNKISDRVIYIEMFDKFVEEYKTLLDQIQSKSKFTTNTLKNLKLDLYNYLTDKQNFLQRNDLPNIKKLSVTQVGKYFKKWSALTPDERLERLESYGVYYVDKNLVETKLIDVSKSKDYIKDLVNLLHESFTSKALNYKHITWNVKRGVIDTIKILKFTDTNTFVLQNTNTNTNETKQTTETTTTNETAVRKKKISVRTIVTKETEKIINEELLHFILKRIQNKTSSASKEDKDIFLERIKTKLKVKKISSNDKTKICDKYDEIFNVVKNNGN